MSLADLSGAPSRPIQWAWVRNKHSPVSQSVTGTVDELFRYFTQVETGEKDGWGWIAGAIEPGPRTENRISGVDLLVLDIEATCESTPEGKRVNGPFPPDFSEMKKTLEDYGIKACIHSTHSNYAPAAGGGDVGPRYRIVFALSRPVNGDELKLLGPYVATELGLVDCLDTKCLQLSRLYYLPRCSDSNSFLHSSRVIEGAPLEVDVVLEHCQALTKPIHSEASSAQGSVIERWDEKYSLEEILERNGYVRRGTNRYLCPGSSTGFPGVVVFPKEGRLYSHHGQDSLNDGYSHDAFDVFKILECEGDFNRALEQARENVGAEIASGEEPDPFDLDAARIGDLLDTDPPPRSWIIRDFLPRGVVGLLIASGGTGKSFLTLQLAVSVTSGIPWLGMDIERSGSVVIFSAEDDRPEIHRRLKYVIDDYKGRSVAFLGDEDWRKYDQRLRSDFYALDRVGCDNRLTHVVDRTLCLTRLSDRIVSLLQEIPESPALIILDPLSRFDGGEPNSNADATRLIECVEKIRKATGATVLLVHHVSKGGARDPEAGQEAARGASALVDGARMALKLRIMTAKDAKKLPEIKEDDYSKYVRLDLVKANYCKPWEGIWLQRVSGGVIRPCDFTAVAGEKLNSDAEYARVLPLIIDHIKDEESKGKTVTRNAFRSLAGKDKRFAVSEKQLNAFIDKAVKDGRIREQAMKMRGKSLHIPPDRVSGELHDKTDNTAGNLDFIGVQPSVV